MWSLMDTHMPGPICVKFSELVEGRWEIHLGQKKSKIFQIEFFFEDFFCLQPNSDLCTRDDSLGFEDCRLATHLLN